MIDRLASLTRRATSGRAVLTGKGRALARPVLTRIAADLQPATWTTGVLAKTARGVAVDYAHAGAVCWCLYGHVERAARIVEWDDTTRRSDAIFATCEAIADAFAYDDQGAQVIEGPHLLTEYNDADGRTFADVATSVSTALARLDDDDHCPTCGTALIWGAGPACPNECAQDEPVDECADCARSNGPGAPCRCGE